MKTAIRYYSKFGHTTKMANIVSPSQRRSLHAAALWVPSTWDIPTRRTSKISVSSSLELSDKQ